MKLDKLFKTNEAADSNFVFDKSVAEVFEDMLNRSIPMYDEIQKLLLSFSKKYSSDGDTIVDLGSSHGHTCINLASQLKRNIHGLDNSGAMIEKAKRNLDNRLALKGFVEFHELDISTENIRKFEQSSVFILSLTLQFIRPLDRQKIVESIYDSLKKDGILLLIEKTILPSHSLNSTFIEFYHSFKLEQGYSETEIAKKRASIENVLVPFSIDENKKMMIDAGFEEVSTFFQWLNFSGIIAMKSNSNR